MVSFLIASSCLLVVCAALPPYYGGVFDNHGSNYEDHGNKYEGYGAALAGHGSGYDAGNYGRASGEDGYYGGDYGSHAAADGHANYANGGADGYGSSNHDEGARHAADANGQKKYSYFTSGSGPEGTYSKGYYGSEGYEHGDSKSKYAADAKGEGFKKGFNYDENDHANGHSAFDKSASAHSDFGKKHDDAAHGFKKDGFEKTGHADGWYNTRHGAAHAAHGPSYLFNYQ